VTGAPAVPAEGREAIVRACRRLAEAGLAPGRAGNVSLRQGQDMLISPSAVPYDRMEPAMVAEMPIAGEGAWRGPCEPSSEWRIHRDLLRRRPEFGAVVHAHPPFGTALALLRRGIPACHYTIVLFGGDDVRCSAYRGFGTPALSEAVLAAMDERSACLMANHGVVVAARSLDLAMLRLDELEALARQYLAALAAGEPVLLSAEALAEARERFSTYGRNTNV
jgi:L-fuculose-phosphate aldolase